MASVPPEPFPDPEPDPVSEPVSVTCPLCVAISITHDPTTIAIAESYA